LIINTWGGLRSGAGADPEGLAGGIGRWAGFRG
jgi:hypothetical protein